MTPSELAEKQLELAHEYGVLSDRLAEVLEVKAKAWPEIREKSESEKQAENSWSYSENGILEMKLRLSLKKHEKLMSSIKALLRVRELEIRNLV